MKFKYNGQWYDISAPVFDGMPIGSIVDFAGDSTKTPSGWLLCDGSAISRSAYSELYGIIGTTYGTGDGSTTFNLPNYKGKMSVGLDTSQTEFDTLGETGGEKTHQLSTAETPSHSHAGLMWAGNVNEPITLNYGTTGGGYNLTYNPGTNASQATAIGTGYTGGGQAHNNLPPYLVVNKIIKVFNITPVIANVENSNSNSNKNVYSCDYVNGCRTITFNNQWLDGIKSYGTGGIGINIPVFNPEGKQPTLNFTEAYVYTSNGWEATGVVGSESFTTFIHLKLSPTSHSSADTVYLIRLVGTITIPN